MRWSPTDDGLLTTLVRSYRDETSIEWSVIAKHFSGRSPKQCREHWYGSVHPDNNKEPWTEEEIQSVERLIAEHGTQWKIIRSLLPTHRSELAIRNMYYATQRKQARAIAKQGRQLAKQLRQTRQSKNRMNDTIVSEASSASSVISSGTVSSSLNDNGDKEDNDTNDDRNDPPTYLHPSTVYSVYADPTITATTTTVDNASSLPPRLSIRQPSQNSSMNRMNKNNYSSIVRSQVSRYHHRRSASNETSTYDDHSSGNDDDSRTESSSSSSWSAPRKYRRITNNPYDNNESNEGNDVDNDEETGTNGELDLAALFGDTKPSDLETPKVEPGKGDTPKVQPSVTVPHTSTGSNTFPSHHLHPPIPSSSSLPPPHDKINEHSRGSSTASMNSLISQYGRFSSIVRSTSDAPLLPPAVVLDNSIPLPPNFGITTFIPDTTPVNDSQLLFNHPSGTENSTHLLSNRSTNDSLTNNRSSNPTSIHTNLSTKPSLPDASPYFPPVHPTLHVSQTNRGTSSNSLSGTYDFLNSARTLPISPSVQPFLYVSGAQPLPVAQPMPLLTATGTATTITSQTTKLPPSQYRSSTTSTVSTATASASSSYPSSLSNRSND